MNLVRESYQAVTLSVEPLFPVCSKFVIAGPPSAPRNVISNINETSVILDWTWPADTGGRKDVTFSVVCKKCGASAQQCEPCRGAVRFLPRRVGLTNTTVTVADLLAHTTYTFEIEALNGISEQGSALKQCAAVTITTNQAEFTVSQDGIQLECAGVGNGVLLDKL
ncbi:UNVERIFIED_CONTAM: hypothetical protein FKN15_058527 [Acipenser sinensis]